MGGAVGVGVGVKVAVGLGVGLGGVVAVGVSVTVAVGEGVAADCFTCGAVLMAKWLITTSSPMAISSVKASNKRFKRRCISKKIIPQTYYAASTS